VYVYIGKYDHMVSLLIFEVAPTSEIKFNFYLTVFIHSEILISQL